MFRVIGLVASRALGAVALIFFTAHSAAAATATVNPIADAYVTSGMPDANFGGAGALGVSAPGLPRGEFQTLMRFDLAAAKAGFDAAFGVGQWSIQSATLQLVTANPNNPAFNANVAGSFAVRWMTTDTWVEGTGGPSAPTSDGVTFNTLPSFLNPADEAIGTFTFPGGTSGSNTYTLDLTNGFATDLAAGNNVSLRLLAADSSMSYLFNSRNFGTVANRPLLTVNAVAVPEPTSVAMLMLVISTAWLGRREPRTAVP
jgi:hypothetical protein